jgi:TonB family protein
MAKSSPKTVRSAVQLSLSSDLAASVHQAREATNAPGAAIALTNEGAGEIVCCARSGTMAPELGTALLAENSLTSQCVRSGTQLQCNDSETDIRVCSPAADRLAARSLVVTPIKRGHQVIGVLVVFSDSPSAFSPVHQAKLRDTADEIAGILKDRVAPDAGQSLPQLLKKKADLPQLDVARPKPPLSTQLPLSITETAKETSSARRTGPVAGQLIEHPTVPLPAASVPVVQGFATFSAVAGQSKESTGTPLILIVAVALLVIAGSATWASLKRTGLSPLDATSIQQQETPKAEIASTSAEAAPRTIPPEQRVNTPEQKPGSDASTVSPRKPELPRKRTEAERRNTTSEQPGTGLSQPAHALSPAPPKEAAVSPGTNAPVTKEATPLVAKADIALPAPVAAPPQLLQTVPVIAEGTPASAATPDASVSSKQAPLLRSDIAPARLIRSVPPQYPAFALQMRTAGMVVVRARVAKDGHLVDPEFLSGPPVFRKAALDAVKLWRYSPATLNGQAVEQDVEIKMEFRPTSR